MPDDPDPGRPDVPDPDSPDDPSGPDDPDAADESGGHDGPDGPAPFPVVDPDAGAPQPDDPTAPDAAADAAADATGTDATGTDALVHPMEVDEKDMPVERARCWTVNATERPVDVYVNYDDEPLVDDVKPMSIGSVVDVSGAADRPYGTYTFEARDRGDPDGEVLAAASVAVDEGDSFSAVLHRVGEFDYRLSVYRNDYSPSADARVVVRHVATPEAVDWRFAGNGETPEVPDDPRSGTLERGEWQAATDVTEADYLFEVLVDGEVVTLHRNLEFEVETTYVVYVVGDPEPLDVDPSGNYGESADSGLDESKWLLVQAFEVLPGTAEPDVVTTPADPVSAADTNRRIEFDCEPLDLYETNAREVAIGATDPDGIVTGLAIDGVDPPTDGFSVVDDSLDRAVLRGETTTATLRVEPDLPPDSYDVRIAANPESLGEWATCTVPVAVEPVPVARLYDLVDEYQLADDVDRPIATELNVLLDDAAARLDADKTSQACAALEDVVTVLGDHKDAGVSERAHDDLQVETEALRERIGCG